MNELSKSEDQVLVELAQGGKEEALDFLFERYYGRILHLARQYRFPGGEEEDVIQEGLVGLYEAIMDYEPSKGSFFYFALLCARRQIIKGLAAHTRQKHEILNTSLSYDADQSGGGVALDRLVLPNEQVKSPLQELVDEESAKELIASVSLELSKAEEAVLVEVLLDKSYEEIAKALKVNEKYVDNAIQRIRRKIRKK